MSPADTTVDRSRPRCGLAITVLTAVSFLAYGCSGNQSSGQLKTDLRVSDSDYLELELATGVVTAITPPDDLSLNRSRWRTTHLLFHRITGGSAPGQIVGLPGDGETEDAGVLTGSLGFIAVFELTVSQWQRLSGGTAAGSEDPVCSLSPNTVMLRLASYQCSDFRLDLPDPGSWMRACTNGRAELFAWGASVEPSITAGYAVHYPTNGGSATAARRVGSLLPNANGLFDMHGNVAEMVVDANDSYQARGGAWDSPIHACRAANVVALPAMLAHPSVGVRLMLRP